MLLKAAVFFNFPNGKMLKNRPHTADWHNRTGPKASPPTRPDRYRRRASPGATGFFNPDKTETLRGMALPLFQNRTLSLHQLFPEHLHRPRCIDSQTDLGTSLHDSDFYGIFITGEGNNKGLRIATCRDRHGAVRLPGLSERTSKPWAALRTRRKC